MVTARNLATGIMGLAFAIVATRGLEAQASAPSGAPAAQGVKVADPPPGPGLAIIQDRCTACHSTTSIFTQHRTPDDWAATVQLMVDRGADLSPDDMNVVIGYLASNYPAKSAADAER